MGKKERIAELEAQVAMYHELVMSTARRLGLGDTINDYRGPVVLKEGEPLRMTHIPRLYEAFHDAITVLRENAKANQVTIPTPLALVQSEVEKIEESRETPEDVAQLLWTIHAIARELDVDTQDPESGGARPAAEILSDAYEAMRELTNGPDVSGAAEGVALVKGDSLAQALQHNHEKMDNLAHGVAEARLALRRIGEALGITELDADGSKVLEKAQQWAVFAYYVKKRYAEWNARLDKINAEIAAGDSLVSDIGNAVRAHVQILIKESRDELANILARLVAQPELAKWLEAKAPGVVTPQLLALAEDRSTGHRYERFTPLDIQRIESAIGDYYRTFPAEPGSWMAAAFTEIRRSPSATHELVALMNLVILPIVTRLTASGAPAAPSPN